MGKNYKDKGINFTFHLRNKFRSFPSGVIMLIALFGMFFLNIPIADAFNLEAGAKNIAEQARELMWVGVIIGLFVVAFTAKSFFSFALKVLGLIIVGTIVYAVSDQETFKQVGEYFLNLFQVVDEGVGNIEVPVEPKNE